ncbi:MULTISPECIES: MFS transporter [unclassified Burkholderia]|uniref:MFS transporter n=1 Tax=unclassified Burkholderia TaxID=2613784 RepID=UPI001421DEFB|nr:MULTISPECIES: MFS transporter [unclassified Burkholderia]NIE82308.1 MFS transporter [Burkholderia sp. Tr-860]NIF62805.1 MFS transporter [Burkholderia sp. Cy-647]NIF71168.1 MFS transporter [Burkholderia sp. Ap-962]NIF94606.1 MFS transporter [Burkholderia sp. Ax-1720]
MTQDKLAQLENRVLGVTFAGWALDAMDFMCFALLTPVLIRVLGVTHGQAGAITSAALFTSALGGWIAGMLADRFGRVRVLQWVVLWFAVFSALCGFAEGAHQLLVLRALQGFGFGGEWAVGAALISEMVRPENRGRTMGIVQSGWSVGWGCAIVLVGGVFVLFPEALGWRVVMWFGAIPALLVVYMRHKLPESPAFLAARQAAVRPPSPGAIFARGLRRNTLLGCLMTFGLQGGYFAVQGWLPTYLATVRGFSMGHTALDMCVVIVGSFSGNLSHGYLSDRIGRRITFIGFALCAALAVVLYMLIPLGHLGLTLMALPLGFFTSGVYGGVGAILAELFPTLMRGAGQGFTYSFGRGMGAIFPAIVGAISAHLSLGMAIAVFASAAYALAAVAVSLMGAPRRDEVAGTAASRGQGPSGKTA